MAFSKNWKQWIVSKGEPFQIEYLDRKFRGRSRVVFKIDDTTGLLTVNGKELVGTQNIVGDLSTTGNADFGGNLGVDGNLVLDGNETVGGTLGVTGVATFAGVTHLPAATIKTKIVAGADASVTPVQTTFAGAVIGNKVVSVIDLNNDADVSADFEATISVTGKIVQTTTDLSAVTHILVQLLS